MNIHIHGVSCTVVEKLLFLKVKFEYTHRTTQLLCWEKWNVILLYTIGQILYDKV